MSYDNFPEVYHAHGISKAPFNGGGGRSRGRGGTQHIVSSSSADTATCCVSGALRAGAVPADPELPLNRNGEKMWSRAQKCGTNGCTLCKAK